MKISEQKKFAIMLFCFAAVLSLFVSGPVVTKYGNLTVKTSEKKPK